MKIKIGSGIFESCDPAFSFKTAPLYVMNSDARPVIEPVAESVIVKGQGSAGEAISSMLQTGVWNVIDSNPKLLEARLKFTSRLIHHPESFLGEPSRELFNSEPIEKVWPFISSSEKSRVLDELRHYVETVPGAKNIVEFVMLAADELFTNAIYNAPFGDAPYTLDRSAIVVLDPEKSAQILLAHDGEHLFLGCLDAFGSLDCEALLSRVQKCFEVGVSKTINLDIGGAGIGIFRIVDLANDVYAVVEEGKKTIVGCRFTLGKSAKQIRAAPKNFHFQQFHDLEAGAAKIRVEHRVKTKILRFIGEVKEAVSMDAVGLEGVEEVELDIRQLKSPSLQCLAPYLASFQEIKSLKNVLVDGVTSVHSEDAFKLEKKFSFNVKVRSLYLSFRCPECSETRKIPFIKVLEGAKLSHLGSEMIPCQSCGASLEVEPLCS